MQDDFFIVDDEVETKEVNVKQEKCPKCGATDISLNSSTGKLRCNFCRHEFDASKYEGKNIRNVEGFHASAGAQDIDENFDNVITIKCSSCGAEVVMDTSEVTNARCHWCRNHLSVTNQIPNGSVPDMVLPFKITKDEAKQLIDRFVYERRFFALPIFKKEYTSENIMGIYFPYMVLDAKGHAHFSGEGEHTIRKYSVKTGKNSSSTRYDISEHYVERDFDFIIENLTMESNLDRLDGSNSNVTNNIINSIMPFDVENSISWNANYLRGYTSEKRNINVEELRPLGITQVKDVARYAAYEHSKYYDRGIRWDVQDIDVEGESWKTAYFPVWLYSYYEKKNGKDKLHYVAVNARTKETMGSVPLNYAKLLFCSFLLEVLGIYGIMEVQEDISILFLIPGIALYISMVKKYRNKQARHKHEAETEKKVLFPNSIDKYIRRRNCVSNSKMHGANSGDVQGINNDGSFTDSIRRR